MAYAPVQLFQTPLEDYAGYWVKFYEQGTTTPLSMATDAAGGTLIVKAEISSGGTIAIGFLKTAGDALLNPFINGAYDGWLFPTSTEADANDTTNAIQVADNLNADPQQTTITDTDGMYTGTSIEEVLAEVNSSVDTIAALKLIEPTAVVGNKKTIYVRGYYAAGDGGGGLFYWDSASTDTDNGGTIIKVTAVVTGRWLRQDIYEVTSKHFGLKGDDTDETTQGQVFLDYCVTTGIQALFVPGSYTGNWTVQTGSKIIGTSKDDVIFKPKLDDAVFKNITTSAGVVRVNFENFTITGDNTFTTAGDGIYLVPSTTNIFVDSLTIRNIRIDTCGREGINLEGNDTTLRFVQGVIMENVIIDSCIQSGIYYNGAILESTWRNVRLRKNGDSTYANFRTALKGASSRVGRLSWIGGTCNNITQAALGGYIGVDLVHTQNINFHNIDFEECNTFIEVSGNTTHGITIIGNRFASGNAVDDGVKIDDCNGFYYNGNSTTATSTWTNGVHVSTTPARCRNIDIGDANQWDADIGVAYYFPNLSAAIATGVAYAYNNIIRLDTEASASTDDLDSLYGSSGTAITTDVQDGKVVMLQSTLDSRDVVVKHGTGNIRLDAGADFTLATNKSRLALTYNRASSQWIELSRSSAV